MIISNDGDAIMSCNEPVVLLDLSIGQRTPLGRLIGDMYYRSDIHKETCNMYHSGYPHNGGEHTLVLQGTRQDLFVLIELLQEQYADKKPDYPNFDTFEDIKALLNMQQRYLTVRKFLRMMQPEVY